MSSFRPASRVLCLLALSLPVLACGTGTPERDPHTSPLARSSPVPTSTPVPTQPPTPLPTRAPLQLVVLHTNDNWGETEPCG
jgi:hypothetical protein